MLVHHLRTTATTAGSSTPRVVCKMFDPALYSSTASAICGCVARMISIWSCVMPAPVRNPVRAFEPYTSMAAPDNRMIFEEYHGFAGGVVGVSVVCDIG